MDNKIYTTKGLVDRSLLTVLDVIDEDERARYIKTQWFLDDELVRQDAWVNMKQGVNMNAEGGGLG